MERCEGKFLIKKDEIYFKEFSKDYYKSLKEYRKDGFSQIAITTYIFLQILKHNINKYSNRSFYINEIHLEDNADDAQQEIDDKIKSANPNIGESNVDSFYEIILLLKDIIDDESVEIEFITYSFKDENEDIYVTLSNTGYVQYEGPKNKVELNQLGKLITRIRHGK